MAGVSRRTMITAGTGLLAAGAVVATVATRPGPQGHGKPLSGKSILVTGTSTGFGNLGAVHYARLGAKVFATMRNLPRPEGEALAKLARDENLDLTVLELDVRSDEQVAAAVAEAEQLAGGALNILVNNAGISIGGSVELQDMEAAQLSFDTNVLGYLRMIRAVLPALRTARSGLIINVSSNRGRVVVPYLGLYSASKFAVESMCEQLAYELVPHGIEVVIIQPGGFPTKIGEHSAALSTALAGRSLTKHASGYKEIFARMEAPPVGAPVPDSADPSMVPQAIAEIAAMAPGTRPLRRSVHPSPQPQLRINQVCNETQLRWLDIVNHGDLARAVLD